MLNQSDAMRMMPALAVCVACAVVCGHTSSSASGATACIGGADPEVWLVKTGGFWEQGKRLGHFRIVVVRRGIEHATDWAQLQILERDDRAGKTKVAACVDLDTPSVKGHIRDVRFMKTPGKRTAIALEMQMNGMGEVVMQDIFLVSGEGKLSKLVEAKAVDLDDD
jgi:hypothetical protein